MRNMTGLSQTTTDRLIEEELHQAGVSVAPAATSGAGVQDTKTGRLALPGRTIVFLRRATYWDVRVEETREDAHRKLARLAASHLRDPECEGDPMDPTLLWPDQARALLRKHPDHARLNGLLSSAFSHEVLPRVEFCYVDTLPALSTLVQLLQEELTTHP